MKKGTCVVCGDAEVVVCEGCGKCVEKCHAEDGLEALTELMGDETLEFLRQAHEQARQETDDEKFMRAVRTIASMALFTMKAVLPVEEVINNPIKAILLHTCIDCLELLIEGDKDKTVAFINQQIEEADEMFAAAADKEAGPRLDPDIWKDWLGE